MNKESTEKELENTDRATNNTAQLPPTNIIKVELLSYNCFPI